MPSIGSAWSFWKTIKEISPRTIREEISQPFKIALVGPLAERLRLKTALFGEAQQANDLPGADDPDDVLVEMDDPPGLDAAAGYAFTLYADGPGEIIGGRTADGRAFHGLPDQIAEEMVAREGKLALALARRFPRLRVPAGNQLIKNTCRINAQFALLSALPGVLPITLPFLPASSVADTLILTKNQVMLVMRLAAMYGHPPGYTKQIKELLGVVGGALGWRAAARELAGLVPGGLGVVLKASIAWSGTFAAGRTALWYYQTGKILTPKEIRALYKKSKDEAKREVEQIKSESGK